MGNTVDQWRRAIGHKGGGGSGFGGTVIDMYESFPSISFVPFLLLLFTATLVSSLAWFTDQRYDIITTAVDSICQSICATYSNINVVIGTEIINFLTRQYYGSGYYEMVIIESLMWNVITKCFYAFTMWHIMSTIVLPLMKLMVYWIVRGIEIIARFIKAVFGNRYCLMAMLLIMAILYVPLVCGYDSSSDYPGGSNSGSGSGSAAAAAGLVALGAADEIGRRRRRDRRGSGEEKRPEDEDEDEVESSDDDNVQTNAMDPAICRRMNKNSHYVFGQSVFQSNSQDLQQPPGSADSLASRASRKVKKARRSAESFGRRALTAISPRKRSATESGDADMGGGSPSMGDSPSSTISNKIGQKEEAKAENNNISNFCENNNEQNNTDNNEIEEGLTNAALEGELDAGTPAEPDNNNAKQKSINEIKIEGDSIVFGANLGLMEGILIWYNKLLKSEQNAYEGTMKGYIAELVKYVNDVKEGRIKFGSDEEMEKRFNEKREWIGDMMAKILKEKKHSDLIPLINLGSLFSVHIVIVFFLHYAPKGVRKVYNEAYNFCRNTQCCIHTMKHKLLNFQINEMKNGVKTMLEWTFGGLTNVDESEKMAIVDLIPFLLDKVKSESAMREQYRKMSDSLGLESFYILMLIPYCLVQMHILLFQECQRQGRHQGIKLQIHAASAYVAKYVFGLVSGTTKYLNRYTYKTFVISFGLHPQACELRCRLLIY